MPLPVIANVARTSFEWTLASGAVATNVMHFQGDEVDLADQVLDAVFIHMDQGMWGAVHSDARISTVRCQPLDGVSAIQERGTPATAEWQGFAGGEPLVPICQIVTLRTGFSGRRRRGRVYLPFIGSAAYDDGQIEASVTDAVRSEWEGFRTAMAAVGVGLVVASYGGEPGGPNWTPFATEVTSVTAQPVAGTQRRRQDQLR